MMSNNRVIYNISKATLEGLLNKIYENFDQDSSYAICNNNDSIVVCRENGNTIVFDQGYLRPLNPSKMALRVDLMYRLGLISGNQTVGYSKLNENFDSLYSNGYSRL